MMCNNYTCNENNYTFTKKIVFYMNIKGEYNKLESTMVLKPFF